MSSEMSDVRHNRKVQNVWWLIAVAMAEMLGTAMLVFLGCTAAVPGMSATPPSHLQVCLAFGFAIIIILQAFAHVSGTHLNPAISIAACIMRLIPLKVVGVYIVSQMIGGILGYATILLVTPTEKLYLDPSNMNKTHGLCTTVPSSNISTFQAVVVEYLATAILIFVCCGVWDKRNADKHASVPIIFGFTITGIALALGTYTGASMNPARSFGPALLTGVWNSHWIYWLSPLSAGVIVTYFYKFIFNRLPPSPEPDQSDVPLNQSNYNPRKGGKTQSEGTTSA